MSLSEAQAADRLVDTTTLTTSASLTGAPAAVWINDQTGFVFYLGAEGDIEMASTTNGGTNWSSGRTVDSLNTIDAVSVAVWWDGWTSPGTTTQYIHIATTDTGTDDLYYTRYDTTNNTLSTTVVATTQSASCTRELDCYPAITKASNNVLYMTTGDSIDRWVESCSTTCTSTANWSERTSAYTGSAGDDYPLLAPIPGTNNIMLIWWDTSADSIFAREYSATSSTWGTAATISTTADDNLTYDAQLMGISVSTTTGKIALTYVDDANDYTTQDHDITLWLYSSSTGWSQKTNPVTNATGGLTGAKVSFDATNNRWYVIYARRSTIGTNTTARLYYQYSSDNGTSWSGETLVGNDAADDLNAITTGITSFERIGVWWHYTNNLEYYHQVADIITAPLVISGTLYEQNGATPVTQSKTIKVAVGTSSVSLHSTVTTAGTGAWSVALVPSNTIAADTPITVWVDGDSSTRASVFTRAAAATTDITGLDLYRNHVIMRNEEADDTVELTHLNFYDNDDDPDIQYNASSTALIVNTNNELYIWPHTLFYAYGGTVTVRGNGSSTSATDGSLHVSEFAEYWSEATTTIAGSLTASSTAYLWLGEGPSDPDGDPYPFIFNATTTGKIILNASNVMEYTFNGVGGGWTFASTATATNFTITNGAVTAPSSNLVIQGDYSNAGTFIHNGGTVNFSSSLSDPATGVSFDTTASGNANPAGIVFGAGFFWIVDTTDAQVYKYNLDGSYTGTSFDTFASGNTLPYGITYAGGFLWVTDVIGASTSGVYKYSTAGAFSSFFNTSSAGVDAPVGIAYDGSFLWVVDNDDDEVYKYNTSGTYQSTSFDTAASGNSNPWGITYANGYFWVTDNQASDLVFKYTSAGVSTGVSFDITSTGNNIPYGIASTTDFFWITDNADGKVYKYTQPVEPNVSLSGTMTGSSAFNDVTFSGDNPKTFSNNASTTNLTISSGQVTAPTLLSIAGNYNNAGIFTAGTGTTTFNGTSAQTATGTMTGTSAFYNIAFKNSTASTTFNAPFTATGHFQAITPSARIEFAKGATTTLNTATIAGSGGAEVWIRSNTSGTKAGLSISSTPSVTFVNVKDSSASTTGGVITATSSTDSGNTNGWTFIAANLSMLLSGILYQDEGVTPFTSAKTIGIAIGTSTVSRHATTSLTSGVWNYTLSSNVNITPSTPILVWIDGDSSNAAVTFTKASTTGNISQINLYKRRVILKHEGFTGTSTTNTDLAFYDGDNDTDIPYTSNAGAFSMRKEMELHLAPGTTYTPGGTVTLNGNASTSPDGDLHLPYGLRQDGVATSSSLQMESNSFALAGSWYASSSAVFGHSATVTFNSTSSQEKQIIATSTTFRSLLFTGAGGLWTFSTNAATATGSFNLANGTVVAPSTYLTVSTGGCTGGCFSRSSGTFTHNGGTVIIASTGFNAINSQMIGANSFNHLIFRGVGTKSFSTNAASTTNLTIEPTSGTVTFPSSALTVSGNFTNSSTTGGFNANGGTVYFSSTTATTTYTGTHFNTAASGAGDIRSITYSGGFFWISDSADAEVYKYNSDGTYTGTSFDTAGSGNGSALGITTYNGFFWVTDFVDAEVYKYNSDGTYTGTSFDTAASGNASPIGIIFYDGFFWIVDSSDAEVYKYTVDGTYTGISFDTAASGNTSPNDIAYTDGFFWIANNVTDEVYKYNSDGTYTGTSFNTAASGSDTPLGIAYANGYLWITDLTDDEVYQYTLGQVLSGTMTGTSALNNVVFIGAAPKSFGSNASTSNFSIESTSGVVGAPQFGNLTISGNYSNATSTGFGHGMGTTTFASTTATTTYTGSSFDTAASGNDAPYGLAYANGFFWIIDGLDTEVYKYNQNGSYTGSSFDTAVAGSAGPRGIIYANGFFWITDSSNAEVYKYNSDGTYTGTSFDTAASGNGSPNGITYANGFFWITDLFDAEVYKYNQNGTYTGTSFDTAASGAASSFGITYGNGFFWVTDDPDDEVYTYTLNGTYTGISFDTAANGASLPTGVAYANGFLWLTDIGNDEVYKYAIGQIASGTMTGASAFNNVTFTGAAPKGFANNASTSNFTIEASSGGVEAPSFGDLSISGNYSNATSTGFGHGWGTTTFNGNTAQTIAGITASTSAFNNVSFAGAGTKTFSNTASTSNFLITSGSGAVTAPPLLSIAGDYTNNSTFTHNNGTTTFNGINAQTATGTLSGSSAFYNLVVANGNASTTFGSSLTVSNLFKSTTPSAILSFGTSTTATISRVDLVGGSGQEIKLRSTATGTQFNFNVSSVSALSYLDVKDSNACGGTTLVARSFIDSGNNSCWSLATTLLLSGSLYADEGNTLITSAKTLGIAIGTSTLSITATTSLTSGAWSLTLPDTHEVGVSTPILVYVDGDATTRAAVFTKTSSATSSISGLDLYQNRVIVRHEATSGASTTAGDLAFYDGDNDADIQYTANSGALTVSSPNELHIWTGKTFAPTSTVTVNGAFHIATSSTYLGTSTTISGDYTNNGTFTAGTGTTTFNGTSAQTLSGTLTGSSPFNGVEFSGAGTKTFLANASTTSFTVKSGSGEVTFPTGYLSIGGNYSNSANINAPTNSLVLFDGTDQNLGGEMTSSSDDFNNLMFANSGTKTFANNASTSDGFVINSGVTIIAPSLLSIGGNYTNNGTFTHNSGTVTFNGASPQSISGNATNTSAFKNIAFAGGGAKTFLSSSASTTNFTIDSTSGSVTAPSQNLSIGGNYTNNSTFTNNSGTVVFNGTAAQTAAGTMTGASAFKNVAFMGTDSVGFSANASTTGDFFINNSPATSGSIASIGTLGTANSTVSNTTLALTTSAAAESGNLVVINIASDNINTTDGDFSEITSVTDSVGGNTWSKLSEYTNGQAGAGAGATISVWYSVLTNTIPLGGTITTTFSNAITAKVSSAWEFSTDGTISLASSSAAVHDGGKPPAATLGGLEDTQYLFLRAVAHEERSQSLTPTANYTAFPTTEVVADGGSATLSMTGMGEFRIVTGTSETSDPTITGPGRDGVSTFVALKATKSLRVTAPPYLSIGGNYTNNGTFTAGTGTTTFNGTSAQTATGTMTGTSAFYNIAFKNSTASTTFNAPFTATGHFQATTPSAKIALAAGATTTLNTATITGSGGAEVWIRSNTSGTKAGLSISSTPSVTFVNVKDSSASTTGGVITATASIDSGNNNGWQIETAASMISLDNQIFAINGPATTISTITIADQSAPTITAANDIRIKIATSSVHMLWDTTDTTATYGGTAASKVSTTVSYEGGGSVLVIPVDNNFSANDTLTISGLSFTQFSATNTATTALAFYSDGASDVVPNGYDSKTVAITGSLTLDDHTLDQVSDAFSFPTATDVELFRFALTPVAENMTVSSLTIRLLGQKGVESDITNIRLYRDMNSNGIYDGGDVQIGGEGVLALTGQSGSITFSTSFVATTSQNYVMVGDLDNIRPGDHVTMSLRTTGVTAIGDIIGSVVPLSGSVTSVQHIKNGAGGGGGSIGGDAPEGEDRGGGSSQGGGEVDTNTNGTSLGNSPGFEAPRSNGSPSNQWTTPSNGYDSDGSYATAASTNLLQSYDGFGFAVPSTNVITGIEVKIEGAGTTAAGAIEVALSWDGGQSYTTYNTTGTLTSTDTIYTLGSPSNTWGHSWTPGETANETFQIVVRAQPSSNTVKIDAIRVRVYHQATGGGGGGGGEI